MIWGCSHEVCHHVLMKIKGQWSWNRTQEYHQSSREHDHHYPPLFFEGKWMKWDRPIIVPSFSDEKTPRLPRHRLMVMKKISWQPRGSSLPSGQSRMVAGQRLHVISSPFCGDSNLVFFAGQSPVSAGQLPVFCNVKPYCLIVAKPQFSC